MDLEKEFDLSQKQDSKPSLQYTLTVIIGFTLLGLFAFFVYGNDETASNKNLLSISDALFSTLIALFCIYKGYSDSKNADYVRLNWFFPIPSKIWLSIWVLGGVLIVTTYGTIFSFITVPVGLILLYRELT